MMRIFLCDDNKILLEKYTRLVKNKVEEIGREVQTFTFGSGEELIFALSEDPNLADIIFLDILMEGKNGIETARELRKIGCFAEIIFLTSSEEFVFDSFDISPMHYLLKDSVSDEKVCAVLTKAVEAVDLREKEMFVFRNGSEIRRIPYANIRYFEVRNRKIHIFTITDEDEFYSTLESLIEALPEKTFIRVHRSYVINMRHLERISKDTVVLSGGVEIPLGATYVQGLKNRFATYLTMSLTNG
ncbi:MAG: LytTR family DNA-binding domain-containing protein [Oscillospiraceae bacterium]|nr:LytTR family DNA-binding domain-containing protein [Oscillospiraceae bacterium]